MVHKLEEENNLGTCRNMIGYNQCNQGYKLFTQVDIRFLLIFYCYKLLAKSSQHNPTLFHKKDNENSTARSASILHCCSLIFSLDITLNKLVSWIITEKQIFFFLLFVKLNLHFN